MTLSLLLTACNDNETGNLLIEEEQQEPVIVPTFTSTTKAGLAKEMKGLIGKRFSCDRPVTISDCIAGAQVVLNIFNNDKTLYTNANHLKMNSFYSRKEKNKVTLDFRNGEDAMRSDLRDHFSRWASANPGNTNPTNDKQVLADYLERELGLNLACQIELSDCQKVVDRVVRAFSDVHKTKFVKHLVIDYVNARLENQVLFVEPQTSLKTIKSLITKIVSVPSQPGPIKAKLKKVKTELKNLSGKTLICDSQITNRKCMQVGKRIIRAYHSGEVPNTRIRSFVATTKKHVMIPRRKTVEVRYTDSVRAIIELLQGHHSRYQ